MGSRLFVLRLRIASRTWSSMSRRTVENWPPPWASRPALAPPPGAGVRCSHRRRRRGCGPGVLGPGVACGGRMKSRIPLPPLPLWRPGRWCRRGSRCRGWRRLVAGPNICQRMPWSWSCGCGRRTARFPALRPPRGDLSLPALPPSPRPLLWMAMLRASPGQPLWAAGWVPTAPTTTPRPPRRTLGTPSGRGPACGSPSSSECTSRGMPRRRCWGSSLCSGTSTTRRAPIPGASSTALALAHLGVAGSAQMAARCAPPPPCPLPRCWRRGARCPWWPAARRRCCLEPPPVSSAPSSAPPTANCAGAARGAAAWAASAGSARTYPAPCLGAPAAAATADMPSQAEQREAA
mmetsp:Transcript_97800/g.281004  ORF Transcript_97800/g.281004 Transcript_97800/m.281004 type:complete len:349 (-) Transcript_97800:55-1101(-)